MGRKTSYTDIIADQILERMASGESLREICRSDGMPPLRTVFAWLRDNSNFADAYGRAQEVRADTLFDEMLEIADDGRNDWMERQQGDEIVKVGDHEHIARSRLRVDSRKWVLSKMAPKKYGERLNVESKSEVTIQNPPLDLSALSAAERDALRSIIMKAQAAARARDEVSPPSMQMPDDRLHQLR